MKAVEVIMEHGVPEDRIIFINLVGVRLLPLSYFGMSSCGERAQISAPEGLKRFAARYPSLRVVCCVSRRFPLAQSLTGDSYQVTGWIDDGLNERAYIVPGLGDFGERRCALPGSAGKWDTLTSFRYCA
jgi:uracil phosphoribosyltransferase